MSNAIFESVEFLNDIDNMGVLGCTYMFCILMAHVKYYYVFIFKKDKTMYMTRIQTHGYINMISKPGDACINCAYGYTIYFDTLRTLRVISQCCNNCNAKFQLSVEQVKCIEFHSLKKLPSTTFFANVNDFLLLPFDKGGKYEEVNPRIFEMSHAVTTQVSYIITKTQTRPCIPISFVSTKFEPLSFILGVNQ